MSWKFLILSLNTKIYLFSAKESVAYSLPACLGFEQKIGFEIRVSKNSLEVFPVLAFY